MLFYPDAHQTMCHCGHVIKRHNMDTDVDFNMCQVRGCGCKHFSAAKSLKVA